MPPSNALAERLRKMVCKSLLCRCVAIRRVPRVVLRKEYICTKRLRFGTEKGVYLYQAKSRVMDLFGMLCICVNLGFLLSQVAF
eukprot:1713760-Rhodomonas_salina.2